MSVYIPLPMRATVVSARTELRVPFACKLCGFEAVARVVGKGSARTPYAPLVAPEATPLDRDDARRSAVADGWQLSQLVACPKCGKRDEGALAAFTRVTRTLQGAAAALFLAFAAYLWVENQDNPALAVLFLVPGALVVFLVGYLRGLRVELSQDRVTFLSPEELAAEASQKDRNERRARRRHGERAGRER